MEGWLRQRLVRAVQIQRLEGSRFVRTAALWALNVGEVLLEGWEALIRVWRECSNRAWVEADVVRGVP